jgi:hypothetical protein
MRSKAYPLKGRNQGKYLKLSEQGSEEKKEE